MAETNDTRGSDNGHKLPEYFSDPDLVDRIFEYIVESYPEFAVDLKRIAEVKDAVRDEFRGQAGWVRDEKRRREREQLAEQVLSLFNGRNASEVARRLDIARPSVYRIIKRAGKIAR